MASEVPALVRAWAIYNECAMWCLIAFCVSGMYLWLSGEVACLGGVDRLNRARRMSLNAKEGLES